jgi:tripartite-type tricarboxylate transporter receptor subunit TctC
MNRTAIRAALLAALCLACFAAPAQDFPARRITIIVPFTAGGLTDLAMRLYAEGLSKRVNQPVLVENRPGGATIIGANAVLAAPPDGHTMLFTGPQGYVPEMHKEKLPFDFLRDFAPVAQIATSSLAMLVNRQQLPAVRTLKELVDHAKANPGKLNSASVSPVPLIAHELFKKDQGLDTVHISYKGQSESDRAMTAGEIQFMLGNLHASFRAPDSRVRILAIAGPSRHPDFPDVPTSAEAGYPRLLIGSMLALFVPAKTPPTVVQRLNQETNAIISQPDFQKRFKEISANSMIEPLSPAALQQQLVQIYKFWGDAARSVGYKPE